MLSDAFRDREEGVPIRYRTDGKLFNQRRLQAVTKVKETVIKDFLFADDCALNATSEQEMQASTDRFSVACDNFMYQPCSGKPHQKSCIKVKGEMLNDVDKFSYLGSTLFRQANINEEVKCRISKTSSAFGRLKSNVWERRGIGLSTKLKVYQGGVISTLLYACESWTVYSRHARQLNHFHTTCLRKLLRIRWQKRIPDTEVLSYANMPSIHTLIEKAQARWAGHILRMNDQCLPKVLLYGELAQGKRRVGRPKLRYKDSLTQDLPKET